MGVFMIEREIAEGTVQDTLPRVEIKNVVRDLLHVVVISTILFLAAGRIDWPAAWVLAIVFTSYYAVMLVWPTLDRKIAALHEQESKTPHQVKPWDKIILLVYPILLLGILITSGLDAGRFHWSTMPLSMRTVGAIALVIGHGAFLWCMSANADALWQVSSVGGRGPAIMRTGPYRYIRHPFYAATVLVATGGALLLGSWWAVVPAGLIAVLKTVRTALEDRSLIEEFPGYLEYTGEVRYRMFPGVW